MFLIVLEEDLVWNYYDVRQAVKIERIYSLFEQIYKSDFNFAGESHGFWECVYVESGSICVSADERVHNLSAGEIIFHKPYELHKFFITSKENARLFIFSCSMEGEICKDIENKVCKLDKRQYAVMKMFLEYLHEESLVGKIDGDGWCEKNWTPLIGSDSAFSQMVTAYISQLVITLSQSGVYNVTINDVDAETFSKAVEYMKNKIDKIPSVWEIAKTLNVSESSLQRAFDKYAKMGVHKYLISLKMKTATELLSRGISVCEVSQILGYSSQNYFSSAYKRETGICPSFVKK